MNNEYAYYMRREYGGVVPCSQEDFYSCYVPYGTMLCAVHGGRVISTRCGAGVSVSRRWALIADVEKSLRAVGL